MKNYILFDNRETLVKWLKNAVMFSAPALAIFFAQLEMGVEPRIAFLVALQAFWGLLADLMKKVGEENHAE